MGEPQKLLQLRESVRLKIGRLQTVLDALELYELASDIPAAAPETVVSGTHRKPTSSPVINISHSTFGALNTGEVQGSIHSHVAAIADAPTADAFRDAVESLAGVVAEVTDLADENRQDALQYIDTLAQEAGDEPPKRRLGVIKGMLLAIPASIQLSGRALEAWDKYGPAIRAHLDQLMK